MDIKKLQKLVVDALEDVKAQDIQLFNTEHLTSMFDRIAVASGTSSRQTKALAASVRDKVKEAGGKIVSIEGENTGEWVLVDLGDIVVHIMQPTIRAYYHLEEIWGGKPVNFATAKRAPKPTNAPSDKKKTPARKTAATKTAKAEVGDKPASRTRKPAAKPATTKAAKPKPEAKAKATTRAGSPAASTKRSTAKGKSTS